MYVGSRLKRAWKSGRRHLKSLPSSRTGENPPYGMIGGGDETAAALEALAAPRSYPTVLHQKLLTLWNAIVSDNLPACTRYAQSLQGLPKTFSRADARGFARAT